MASNLSPAKSWRGFRSNTGEILGHVDRLMGGRSTRRVGNNTILRKHGDNLVDLELHGNRIMSFDLHEGIIRMYDGGYPSVTTTRRLNEWLPWSTSVHRRKGVMYVERKFVGSREPFVNGMAV